MNVMCVSLLLAQESNNKVPYVFLIHQLDSTKVFSLPVVMATCLWHCIWTRVKRSMRLGNELVEQLYMGSFSLLM